MVSARVLTLEAPALAGVQLSPCESAGRSQRTPASCLVPNAANLGRGTNSCLPFEGKCKQGARLALKRRTVTLLTGMGLSAMPPPARASAPVAAASANGSHSLEVRHKDLLVVGPGVLGTLIAQQWFKSHPDAAVVGQTNTTNAHERLRSIGVRPVVKDLDDDAPQKFPYVVFCAPPSGSEDYAAEVSAAAARWDGSGALLFTSSTGVYPQDDGSFVDETSPAATPGASPRLDRLLAAEAAVLGAGGCVVRLAGLYLADRGAHTFWVTRETVPGRPDSYVNLIHYEDAASLAVAILDAKPRGETFMGCDNHPVTRQEIMDIALESGHFKGPFRGFEGKEGGQGKKMHNDLTRAKLGWQPRYHSFADFFEHYQPAKSEAKA
ncbi:hypothetical protein KFL_010200030 [Klebsormidium nitens]|uniref:NAD(P)-binding domain-containing protein n=1 Tax=Klebsormidium nitens TaxID=105231 RepID=A0A1Y1IUV3_KLENI|nr:hypothetical protein KFL_010200030 [Klebsormidium nitens]|eukprot:GAQ92467.1 hypothetical protein KFL_010200030 [Klebsormidium nitens]